jgi:Protein of unknown function (DUF3606)
MLCARHPTMRNKLNLANARQVRILKKRLSVSEDELRRIAEKVGDSIAAITKEVESDKMAAAKAEAATPQPIIG